MRVKLLTAVTLVDAAGPQMSRGETVNVFNDLVALAPCAIVGARCGLRFASGAVADVHDVGARSAACRSRFTRLT